MSGGLEQRSVRVFCTTHRIGFAAPGGARILCAREAHVLARNFPFEDFWEYCCGCQTFWPSNVLKLDEAAERCPSCERRIERRHLCDRCQTLSVESDEPAHGKSFTVATKGGVLPSCPGCLRAADPGVQKHRCKELGVTFTTPRAVCPFCNEATALPVEKILAAFTELQQTVEKVANEQQRLAERFNDSLGKLLNTFEQQHAAVRKELNELKQRAVSSPSPPAAAAPPPAAESARAPAKQPRKRSAAEFPIRAEDYLNLVRSKLVPVKQDFIMQTLVRAEDGEATMYLVEDGGAPAGMSYVVPRVKRFQMRTEYDAYYSYYFYLPNPAAGDITIVKPALVTKSAAGWQLHEEGELKVL